MTAFQMVHPLLFYTLSGLMVVGALGVIFARVPIYAVLSLVITLFGMSALFVALGAYFVAAIQVLVYAGAVLVLFLFVVMLLEMAPEALFRTRSRIMMVAGIAFGGIFLWQLVHVTVLIGGRPGLFTKQPVDGTTAAVGKLLFTTYALPFEAASMLLLVGIIGAIVLAKKKL